MSWNAIYVKSRSEKNVAELLKEKQVPVYLPLIKTMRQWSDRKKMVEFPLLSGYVFVQMENNQQDKILQTKGVVNFVRSLGKIAVIREVEIDRLKQLVSLGYQLETSAISKEYKEGDKIKINSGMLRGLEGYVINHNNQKQIDVLLESIGQCITVKLPADILMMAEK